MFAPSGFESTQTFEVNNPSKEQIAVEISMWTMDRDEDYAETNKPAEDDFLIFPAQMILAPGAHQTVRVKWLGQQKLEREQSYRIVAEQLPIQTKPIVDKDPAKLNGGVKIFMKFKGSVFVQPSAPNPLLVLQGAEPSRGPDGQNKLALTFSNSGNSHATIKQCAVRVSSKSSPVTVDLKEAMLTSLNNLRVPAGARRRFKLPWPAGLPAGPLAATGRCDLKL